MKNPNGALLLDVRGEVADYETGRGRNSLKMLGLKRPGQVKLTVGSLNAINPLVQISTTVA